MFAGSFVTVSVRPRGRHFDLLQADGVGALAVGPAGDLWVGTTECLKRVPLETLRHFDLSAAIAYRPGRGSASDIRSLRFDRDGGLWVGTDASLFHFNDGGFGRFHTVLRGRKTWVDSRPC
jgi:Predicted periplasmic ligand-binding sensor domain